MLHNAENEQELLDNLKEFYEEFICHNLLILNRASFDVAKMLLTDDIHAQETPLIMQEKRCNQLIIKFNLQYYVEYR